MTENDLSYVLAIDQDWQIQKTLFGTLSTPDESKQRLGRWLQMWTEHGFGFWIFSDAANNAVGHGGLFPSRHNSDWIELGYVLKPAHWKLGYATEIAIASCRVGFEKLGLDRIVAVAQADNRGSRRVMEKCGFSFEREFVYAERWPSVLYMLDRVTWLNSNG